MKDKKPSEPDRKGCVLGSLSLTACVQTRLICDASSDYLIKTNAGIGGQVLKGVCEFPEPGVAAHAHKPRS